MRKKALVLGLALALALSQAALAVGAGSPGVSNGSGGPEKTDLTTDSTTTINSETGQTEVNNHGSETQDGSTAAAENQDTANGPSLSVPGGPATGQSAAAAPEVNLEDAAAMTAPLSGYNVSTTNTYAGYADGAAAAINAVNANPASLTALPSNEDLTQYSMLTAFQEVSVTDAQTGAKVTPAAGQCVAISVPALQPGMRVYLLYVDPLTCLTVRVEARGVDYVNHTVLVDASVPGAFSIVYQR